MNYVEVILQSLVGIICFTMPGFAFLSLWKEYQMPLALLGATSFVLSSILIAAWQFITLSIFDLSGACVLTWLLGVAILLYTVLVGKKVIVSHFLLIGVWEQRALVLIAIIVFGWLLTMPLSPYPSQNWAQLGDPPNYYHVAANLIAGKGWQPEYFIGDYLNGALPYVTTQPILVLVTTFFFQLFGVNWYSLYVYDVLAGGLLIYLLAMLVCWQTSEAIQGKRIFFLAFGFACLPSFFILFGLGVVTVPGALAFATIAAIGIVYTIPRTTRYWVALAAIAFLMWVRPEAALLAVLLLVSYCAWQMLIIIRRLGRVARGVSLFGFLMVLVLFWTNLPIIIDALPTSFQSLAVFFIRFDPSSQQFVEMYVPYWELNRKLGQVNWGQVTFDEIKNGAIGLELSANPIAFLKFLLMKLGDTAVVLVPAISFPENIGIPPLMALAILGVFIAFALVSVEQRLVVGVILMFLLYLPLLNLGAGIRHYLTITPVLVALALRTIIQNWRGVSTMTVRRSTIWMAMGLMCLIVGLDFSRLIAIRLAPENTSYVSILRDIQTATPPNARIASSYPQLITCVTGRPSVGTTWLVEDIELIVKKYTPEFILIDDARDGPANYSLLAQRTGLTIVGYVPVVHNSVQQYVLFRAISSTSSAD